MPMIWRPAPAGRVLSQQQTVVEAFWSVNLPGITPAFLEVVLRSLCLPFES